MSSQSSIEWTDATWNPVTGCSKVSPGCKFCYAERLAKRLQAMGQANYANGFRLTLQPHMLEVPLRWRKPRTVFVNSMSDLFHKDVPLDYIRRVFDVMGRAHWHRFQVLTKRAERVLELSSKIKWADNVWMGVSVESGRQRSRIDQLRSTGARIKFLSLEPLLGPLESLDLLGHRGRRVRPEGPSDRSGLGARPEGPVPEFRRPVLLQAVGRQEQEEGRTAARRPDL